MQAWITRGPFMYACKETSSTLDCTVKLSDDAPVKQKSGKLDIKQRCKGFITVKCEMESANTISDKEASIKAAEFFNEAILPSLKSQKWMDVSTRPAGRGLKR